VVVPFSMPRPSPDRRELARLLAKSWREELHPRDQDGRFADTPSTRTIPASHRPVRVTADDLRSDDWIGRGWRVTTRTSAGDGRVVAHLSNGLYLPLAADRELTAYRDPRSPLSGLDAVDHVAAATRAAPVTASQRAAVRDFTVNGRAVNAALRSGPETGEHAATADDLQAVIRNVRTSKPMIVRRGVANFDDVLPTGLKFGSAFVDFGFPAATGSRQVAEQHAVPGTSDDFFLSYIGSFQTMMTLNLPAGSHVLAPDAVDDSSPFASEHTLLLPRGSRFTVIGFAYERGAVQLNLDADTDPPPP
jgi:hypothetical protein